MNPFKKQFAEWWGAWYGRRGYPSDDHTVAIPEHADAIKQTFGYQPPGSPPHVPVIVGRIVKSSAEGAPSQPKVDNDNVVELRHAATGQ